MGRSRAVAQLIVHVFALIGLAVLLVLFIMKVAEVNARGNKPSVPLSENPLDAIAYESPKFADGVESYKVHDRSTGRTWWLVRMDGEWVVLPIGGAE